MARDATTIMANYTGNCTTHGPDIFASALNWATSNGARIINHSYCTGTGPDPNAHDIFFDYKARVSPYPLVAASAGNGFQNNVCNKLRNGLSVGGTLELNGSSQRALAFVDNKSWKNGTSDEAGYEVPHLTAISENVDTAGYTPGTTFVNWGGTSAAAPQVAGIVASLHEANTALESWPEVLVPGMMVAADEDTDGTVLNLNDSTDDRDGAGLVSAWRAAEVLIAGAKVNGGNSPIRAGHDYGSLTSGGTPAQSFYSEQYNARVPNGKQLRSAFFAQTRPTCPSNPGSWSCSPNPYPHIATVVYDGANIVGLAWNTNTNYSYVAFTNTSGTQKDYVLKMYLIGWNGLTSTTFGMAWSSY